MSERVLVTGASGFVGSHVARRFLRDGAEVHAVVRPASRLWRLGDDAPAIRLHQADLTDAASLARVLRAARPDVICHLATASLYQGQDVPMSEAASVNLLGTAALLDAAEAVGYRAFINTGSSSEYGPKQAPMTETDRCEPANTYAIAKCAATQVARLAAARHGRPVVTLRLFSPFGPLDDERRLIPYLVSQALGHDPIHLTAPDAVRDFVFIDDVVEAYVACARRPEPLRGQALNVGSGQQATVREIAEAVVALAESRSRITTGAAAAPRPWESPVWQADITAIRETVGWAPRCSLRDGLARTIAWARQQTERVETR